MEEKDLITRLGQIEEKLDIAAKRRELTSLQGKLADPELWSDWHKGQEISKKAAELQREIEAFDRLRELAAKEDYSALEKELEDFELKAFLSGPHDPDSAILTIRAGQGGVEAMDWAAMLRRMYEHFAANRGWGAILVDESRGEEAGIKSATLEILGRFAYGNLRGERGVHRLVRQSPFNSDNLRQTSFASVEAIPLLEDAAALVIKPDDLEVDSFRSSGPGGQHMQKNETAVRIKHLPTGITVSCQSERSQNRNKEMAMSILRSRLYELEEEKRLKEEQELRGEYKPPDWGNQIRSYVLHPYKMVKDLRTGVESSNPEAVLDGDLDAFIEAELRG